MTLYETIHTASTDARKRQKEYDAKGEKNLDKEVLGITYNELNKKAIDTRVNVLDDATSIAIIKKVAKQLDEEREYNIKANRTERANELEYQKNLILAYLPKQMSEQEILDIINTLEDKSMPSIMKHFKTNYQGKVDMGLVSKLARGL